MNFSEKYGIVISFPEKRIKFHFIKLQEKADIKNDYLKFSKSEKKIFNLIQNANQWKEKIDENEILEELKNISFKILLKDNKVFELKYSPKKTPAEFLLIKEKKVFPEKKDDFILKIEDNNFKFFFVGLKAVFVFSENTFFEITSENKTALSIIKRAFLQKYSKNSKQYSQKKETSFSADEVFEINEIQKELKNIFELNSNLPANFHIQEIKEKKEILEINYKHKENFVEIIPYLDYKIKKIPISESIRLNKKNQENPFSRKYSEDLGFDFLIKIENDRILWAKIDLEKEVEFYKHLLSLKNELGLNAKMILKVSGLRQTRHFLEKNWKNFKTLPFEKIYLNEKIDFEMVKFKADVDFSLKNSENLLNLKADFYLGENKITLEDLKKYAQKKDDFIAGENGSLLKIENNEELERLISILNRFQAKEEAGLFEGKLYHATELQDIFTNSEYYKTKKDAGFEKFLNDLEEQADTNKKPIDFELPKKFKTILRPYQTDGVGWMNFLKKYNLGGILADDMGLGKTLQALILLSLKKNNKASIVIAPKSVLENWKIEAKRFTPELKTIIIDGDNIERYKKISDIKDYDLVITSYSLFQRDAEIYKEKNIKFYYAILDEAQYIKNFRTQNAIRVKEIDSEHRLALTGTPLENSISEIWSIFEFLMPGFLGSQKEFTKKFVSPISQGDKKSLKKLQKKITFFMLRRLKTDVLSELPEKTEQKLFIDLSPDQKILYQEILNKLKKEFFNEVGEQNYKKSYIHILAALTKLRQICNHPNLLMKDEDYQKYHSGKLLAFNELISELISEKRKILVFSQFTSMLDILEEEIQKKKISFARLDGSTKNRQKLIDDFNQDEKKQIFLISLKAGGIGLNLTSADSVIIFDPWWNPSTENQAIDRAHRIGQKKSVNVYKLISKDSIEEKILNLQKEKASLFDSIVNKTETNFKKMNWEDIKNLFEL